MLSEDYYGFQSTRKKPDGRHKFRRTQLSEQRLTLSKQKYRKQQEDEKLQRLKQKYNQLISSKKNKRSSKNNIKPKSLLFNDLKFRYYHYDDRGAISPNVYELQKKIEKKALDALENKFNNQLHGESGKDKVNGRQIQETQKMMERKYFRRNYYGDSLHSQRESNSGRNSLKSSENLSHRSLRKLRPEERSNMKKEGSSKLVPNNDEQIRKQNQKSSLSSIKGRSQMVLRTNTVKKQPQCDPSHPQNQPNQFRQSQISIYSRHSQQSQINSPDSSSINRESEFKMPTPGITDYQLIKQLQKKAREQDASIQFNKINYMSSSVHRSEAASQHTEDLNSNCNSNSNTLSKVIKNTFDPVQHKDNGSRLRNQTFQSGTSGNFNVGQESMMKSERQGSKFDSEQSGSKVKVIRQKRSPLQPHEYEYFKNNPSKVVYQHSEQSSSLNFSRSLNKQYQYSRSQQNCSSSINYQISPASPQGGQNPRQSFTSATNATNALIYSFQMKKVEKNQIQELSKQAQNNNNTNSNSIPINVNMNVNMNVNIVKSQQLYTCADSKQSHCLESNNTEKHQLTTSNEHHQSSLSNNSFNNNKESHLSVNSSNQSNIQHTLQIQHQQNYQPPIRLSLPVAENLPSFQQPSFSEQTQRNVVSTQNQQIQQGQKMQYRVTQQIPQMEPMMSFAELLSPSSQPSFRQMHTQQIHQQSISQPSSSISHKSSQPPSAHSQSLLKSAQFPMPSVQYSAASPIAWDATIKQLQEQEQKNICSIYSNCSLEDEYLMNLMDMLYQHLANVSKIYNFVHDTQIFYVDPLQREHFNSCSYFLLRRLYFWRICFLRYMEECEQITIPTGPQISSNSLKKHQSSQSLTKLMTYLQSSTNNIQNFLSQIQRSYPHLPPTTTSISSEHETTNHKTRQDLCQISEYLNEQLDMLINKIDQHLFANQNQNQNQNCNYNYNYNQHKSRQKFNHQNSIIKDSISQSIVMRAFSIMEIMFLVSAMDGRLVKKLEKNIQVQDFPAYFKNYYDRFKETILYFQ